MPNDSSLRQQVADLGALLVAMKRSIATVESCTGGGVAQLITELPGSSRWFERGFVTYSNAAKMQMVGVAREVLERHGAVSVEVAAAMAEGGLRHSDADYCVSITGIAGPDGGSADKPVGTVCFAWAGIGGGTTGMTRAESLRFDGDRQAVREQSIARAIGGVLDLLRAEA